MQIALLEIHDTVPAPVLDKSISNIPLFRDRPIKNGCSRWNFEGLQRDPVLDHCQSSPDSIARDAPANGVQFLGKPIQFLANLRQILLIEFV